MTRQRSEQLRNIANGMCQFHKHRPLFNSTIHCKECWEKNRARSKTKKPHPLKTDWAKVDWTKGDLAIAEQMNVTKRAVQWRRVKARAPGVLSPKMQRWIGVDWSKRNKVIAEELGVSIYAVWRQRHKKGGANG